MIYYMNAEDIRSLLMAGDFRLTTHARQRMSERNVTRQDIRVAVEQGTIKTVGDKFEVTGLDETLDPLKVVCVFDNGVLIITVM